MGENETESLSTDCRMTGRIRVVVIGAGAAGLCALRHLTAQPSVFAPQCYEKTLSVAGTWVYTDAVNTDKDGFPIISSMYKNLITNLPKEIMAFPDFPFPDNLPSFIHHTEVLKYLNSYCSNHNLLEFIQFGTKVTNISPEEVNGSTQWNVTTENVDKYDGKRTEIRQFDAVIVCNGHFTKPLLPKIQGSEKFLGLSMHSLHYRTPEPFTDLTVMCLGANPSGQDISIELCSHASRVILSHNKPCFVGAFPKNLVQKVGVKELREKSVVFLDDTEADIDAIVYCTGYLYDFSFLSTDCRPTIEQDRRIHNLYKHLIYTKHPSLAFVGITMKNVPFQIFHYQLQFLVAVLAGSLKLPSEEEMEEDIRADFVNRVENHGLRVKDAHIMEMNLQWEYIEDLAASVGVKGPPSYVSQIFNDCAVRRKYNPCTYKLHNFSLNHFDNH